MIIIPKYLYVINDPPCNSVYAAKRLNKQSLLLLLLLLRKSGCCGEVAVSGSSTTDCFNFIHVVAAIQIYSNKRKFLYKKKVESPQASFFGTLTWPVFHCFVHHYGGHDVCQKKPGQYPAISGAMLIALLAKNAQ